MDGAFFYWVAWISWTISTFIMPKTKHRFYLSLTILLMIYCSRLTLYVENQPVNAVIIMIVLMSYAYIGLQKNRIMSYSIFVSILISLCYIGLHFIIVYDPIWVVLDVTVFIALPISLIILFMIQEMSLRIPILLSGLSHGEIGFVILFKDMMPDYTIGSLVFLDIIAISCLIIFLWSMYEVLASTLKVKVDKPIKHVKEKAQ